MGKFFSCVWIVCFLNQVLEVADANKASADTSDFECSCKTSFSLGELLGTALGSFVAGVLFMVGSITICTYHSQGKCCFSVPVRMKVPNGGIRNHFDSDSV